MTVEVSAETIQLFVLVECCGMYHFLKNSHERFDHWEDVCEEMNVCVCYIDFFHIVDAYPRLLVCGTVICSLA